MVPASCSPKRDVIIAVPSGTALPLPRPPGVAPPAAPGVAPRRMQWRHIARAASAGLRFAVCGALLRRPTVAATRAARRAAAAAARAEAARRAAQSRRWALRIAYDGAGWHGWQRQERARERESVRTLQRCLEEALRAVVGRAAPLTAASQGHAPLVPGVYLYPERVFTFTYTRIAVL